MKDPTLNDLMTVKLLSPEVGSFDPVPAILKWNSDGKAKRKPGYKRKKKEATHVDDSSSSSSDEEEEEEAEQPMEDSEEVEKGVETEGRLGEDDIEQMFFE